MSDSVWRLIEARTRGLSWRFWWPLPKRDYGARMIKSRLASVFAALALITAPTVNAVPLVGGGGLTPNASDLASYVMNSYPGVRSIGGVRSDALPDHPSGRAIDIMIGSDMGLGDAIAADVRGQAGNFGVSYVLWRVANHFDHVHVSVF